MVGKQARRVSQVRRKFCAGKSQENVVQTRKTGHDGSCLRSRFLRRCAP